MKKTFSVVMSVYNEKISELRASIDSVLSQSFEAFEFVIVCDNPEHEPLKDTLMDYARKDKRIKIIWNNENMGLALSLNAGIMASQGEYLIRMDADDISKQGRFEKQVREIVEGKYDLIWSSYEFIDEAGRRINKEPEYIADSQIPRILPLENIIHHPTVVMTKKAFLDAGMYRKFPCAQDYDLWLRMLAGGCKMHMMPDSLLLYRVRGASVTNKRKYQQLCTLDYIRHVAAAKKKRGIDIYSYEGYMDYMKKWGVGDERIESGFMKAQAYVAHGKMNMREHQYARGSASMAKGFLASPFYRKQSILAIKRKMAKRERG